MNKQDLIKRIEVLPYTEGPIADTITINRNWILESIKQLDEPEAGHADEAPRYCEKGKVEGMVEREKVTIPQFVAEYIEFKKKNNFHFYGAMRTIEDHYDKKVPAWFYAKNIEKFCLAWILGYEIEKEKRYIVTLKSSGQKLYYHTKDEDYIFSSYDDVFYSDYHTKTDLEENGMSWVFDCEGIEIEEVE